MQDRQVEVTDPEASQKTDRNRNLWIIVALVVVVACICVVGAAALVGGSFFISGGDGSVPGFGQETAVERIVDVSPGTRLQVDNFAGALTVEATDGHQVRVVATKQGPLGLNLDRIEVDISQQANTVVIRTRRPAGLTSLSVNLEIRAPRDTPLDLHTGAGRVTVEGFVAGVMADTGSGRITAQDLAGSVELATGSGSVEARDVDGQLRIDSGSGSLTVQGVDGNLEAHTGSGGIDVLGADGNVRLDTGSGTLEYQGTPAGECRFETGTGSVVLRLPADLDFRLRAETGSGSVDLQFQVDGRISRQQVEGVVGTGQDATLIVSSGSGGIDILHQ